MYNFSKIFVTLFYLGYSKILPGTVAAFISFFLIYFLKNITNNISFFLIFFIIFFFAIYFIDKYIKFNNVNDPSEIVIDEFLGVFIIYLFIDFLTNMNIYIFMLSGFFLFRFFDILKPFPIGWIDKKINNSLGIILDDLLAGLFTVFCLLLINEFI